MGDDNWAALLRVKDKEPPAGMVAMAMGLWNLLDNFAPRLTDEERRLGKARISLLPKLSDLKDGRKNGYPSIHPDNYTIDLVKKMRLDMQNVLDSAIETYVIDGVTYSRLNEYYETKEFEHIPKSLSDCIQLLDELLAAHEMRNAALQKLYEYIGFLEWSIIFYPEDDDNT